MIDHVINQLEEMKRRTRSKSLLLLIDRLIADYRKLKEQNDNR